MKNKQKRSTKMETEFENIVLNLAKKLNIDTNKELITVNKYDKEQVYHIFEILHLMNFDNGYFELIENPKKEIYFQFNYYFPNEDQIFSMNNSSDLQKELNTYKKFNKEFEKYIEKFETNYQGNLERFQIVDTKYIYDYEDVKLHFSSELLIDIEKLSQIIIELIVKLKPIWELGRLEGKK